MSPAPSSARAAFFLSLGLVMLGSCGVTNGAGLASTAARPMLPTIEADKPAVGAAMAKVTEVEQEIVLGAPHRRAFGAADAVVSLMLIVGSFLLVTRHPATVWWVKNAVIANVLVHWGLTINGLLYAHSHRRSLLDAFESLALASGDAVAPTARTFALWQAYFFVGAVFALSVAVTIVHLYLAYRVTRPDIREFLESRPSH